MKKGKGSSHHSNLASSFDKALIIEMVIEVMTSIDLEVITSTSASEALEGKEEGPVTIEETQVEVGEALPLAVESPM